MAYGNTKAELFDKDDALELDQEEVDQLLGIFDKALQGVLGDGIILPGAGRTGNPTRQNDSTNNLKRDGNWMTLAKPSQNSHILTG